MRSHAAPASQPRHPARSTLSLRLSQCSGGARLTSKVATLPATPPAHLKHQHSDESWGSGQAQRPPLPLNRRVERHSMYSLEEAIELFEEGELTWWELLEIEEENKE